MIGNIHFMCLLESDTMFKEVFQYPLNYGHNAILMEGNCNYLINFIMISEIKKSTVLWPLDIVSECDQKKYSLRIYSNRSGKVDLTWLFNSNYYVFLVLICLYSHCKPANTIWEIRSTDLGAKYMVSYKSLLLAHTMKRLQSNTRHVAVFIHLKRDFTEMNK